MSNSIDLSAEDRQIVYDLRIAGKSYAEIVAETGISEWVCRKTAHQYGFDNLKRNDDERKILELFDSGLMFADISRATGISCSTVQKVCKDNGRTKKNMTPQQRKIATLWNQGLSINDICVQMGRDRKNIRQTLVTLGLYEVDTHSESRTCVRCGKEFSTPRYTKRRFCSDACRSAYSHSAGDVKRRMLKKSQMIDHDITLDKVVTNANGKCALCGEQIDWNDFSIVNGKKCAGRRYPSMDHIVPLSKGGLHEWENIQLAHFGCNASKGANV